MRRTWPRLLGLAIAAGAAVVGACGGGGGGGGGGGASGPTATLRWDGVADGRVKGYRVYYGTASRAYAQTWGAGLDAGMDTNFVVTSLESGRTYFFAVTAYGEQGEESDYSNEVSKEIN